MRLGHLIREKRTSAGLTKEQLAARAGISATYLTQIENHTHHPSRPIVERIASALDLPADTRLVMLSFFAYLPSELIDRIVLECIDAGTGTYDCIQGRLLQYRIEAVKAGHFRTEGVRYGEKKRVAA